MEEDLMSKTEAIALATEAVKKLELRDGDLLVIRRPPMTVTFR